VQLGAQRYRGGTFDMWNTVAAGTFTMCATGLALPGGLAIRVRGVGLGLAVGAGICVPLAYVLQEIDRSVVEAGGVPVAYTIPTVKDLVEASGWAGADTIPRKPRDHTAEVNPKTQTLNSMEI
jgi:hypothetical protein